MIKVLGDRVLVVLAPREHETTTASGLVIMKDPDLRTETQGIVVALGEKSNTVDVEDVFQMVHEMRYSGPDSDVNPLMTMLPFHEVLAALRKLRPAPFDVAVGDCVLFARGVGELIEDFDIRYLILHEYEIFGVIEPRGHKQTCSRCGGAYYGEHIHQCKDYVPAWATNPSMIGAK